MVECLWRIQPMGGRALTFIAAEPMRRSTTPFRQTNQNVPNLEGRSLAPTFWGSGDVKILVKVARLRCLLTSFGVFRPCSTVTCVAFGSCRRDGDGTGNAGRYLDWWNQEVKWLMGIKVPDPAEEGRTEPETRLIKPQQEPYSRKTNPHFHSSFSAAFLWK